MGYYFIIGVENIPGSTFWQAKDAAHCMCIEKLKSLDE